ncbi:HYC_CC_PP family protein [Wenyingzhuangia marina]|uniref:Uncharacterized protein n=1 Tax=Wenyingzhuangia marina TaxID=1195760 RepID=A0A1M5V2D7_9FLAO|nr:hypothetical protein [Wenyingzhuangia marina]GGF74879.1 hypothetical protein GCM10011397_17240 [Wenyingzhuangia marina]SHH69447.1 hypothetical protein SAMN05444281_1452 [Wenyingzhuangia marina]
MKNSFHKYMAVVLALIVVFSTVSVTLTMHFCGEKISDVTVLQNVKTCCADTHKSDGITQVSKKTCCSDVKITKDSQTEIQTQNTALSIHQKVFFTSFVTAYLSLFGDETKQDVTFLDYSPPLVVKPIYKLDEVYLI